MTDLAALFEQIRQLPPRQAKQVKNYVEYVVSGSSRKDRRVEGDATLEAVMDAIEKRNRLRSGRPPV